jgi:hypothetical protein
VSPAWRRPTSTSQTHSVLVAVKMKMLNPVSANANIYLQSELILRILNSHKPGSTHTNTNIHTQTHTNTHKHTQTQTQTYTYTHKHKHTNTQTQKHKHKNTNTPTQTHTHTQRSLLPATV